MVIAQPAPFVSTFVDAVDQAIREHSPSHGMSAMQRPWLAFCVTAVLASRQRVPAKANEKPDPGLWAIEPHIGRDGVGAKWEEIVDCDDFPAITLFHP